MTSLTSREIALFSTGLATLYSAGDMDSLSGRVTACLHTLFDCEVASFDLLDSLQVRWSYLVVSPVIDRWPEVLSLLEHHSHEHPVMNHIMRTGSANSIRISDLLSLRQYRRLGIYRELFRPYVLGVDRQLGFAVKSFHGVTFGISLNRRGLDFKEEHRTLLDLLRPHLMQAYTAARDHALWLEHRQLERERFGEALGGGLCELDRHGRLLSVTAAVEKLLDRYYPSEAPRRGRGLPDALWQKCAPLLRPLPGADLSARSVPRTWCVPGVAGTLKIRLMCSDPARGTWQLLLVEEVPDPPAAELSARHGLTSRQGEVLFWVGQGKSNEEIGLILGVSPRTVAKHVESLFAKLHVYNRTAAARLALAGSREG